MKVKVSLPNGNFPLTDNDIKNIKIEQLENGKVNLFIQYHSGITEDITKVKFNTIEIVEQGVMKF